MDLGNLSAGMITDIVFAAIILAAVLIGVIKGLFKSIAGIAGTVIGFIGAKALCEYVAVPFSKLIVPTFEKTFSSPAVQNVLQSVSDAAAQGVSKLEDIIYQMDLPDRVADLIVSAFNSLGMSLSDFAAKYSDGTLTSELAAGAANAVTPVLAFILLFIVIKLVVALVCRLLSGNIPVVRVINRVGGAIVGALSGLLIVVLLCWGIVLFAGDGSVWILSRATLEESTIGNVILGLFWR